MDILNAYVDCHCHILPGIDDGAKNERVSLEIADRLVELGFDKVVATPHYYYHEIGIDDFIKQREDAFSRIDFSGKIEVLLGAEVALYSGLSRNCDLSKLTYPGTDMLLVELPMKKYLPAVSEELFDIKVRQGLTPVIAHIERYCDLFSEDDYAEVLSVGGLVCQFSIYSFAKLKHRRFFKKIHRAGLPVVIGSDLHRIDYRFKNMKDGMNKLSKIVSEVDYERITKCREIGLSCRKKKERL